MRANSRRKPTIAVSYTRANAAASTAASAINLVPIPTSPAFPPPPNLLSHDLARRSSYRGRRIVSAIALLATFLAPVAPAAAIEDGARIELTGLVTDATGTPISGLQVTLEASRQTFSLRHFERRTRDVAKVATRTNERGEYALGWVWASYYNHFELVVALPVRDQSGERLSELTRQNVTGRIRHSPVVAALVVEDRTFLDAYRIFIASLDTPSEHQVFTAHGKPDKIDTRVMVAPADQAGGTSRGEESTWWYFALGKSYVFANGQLLREVPFAPVVPLGGGT